MAEPQAIIVLGGGISADGTLTETSEARVNHALELYHRYEVPLVMAGRWSLMSRRIPARSESVAMRERALQQGIPATDVYTEEKSLETMGNAYFTYKQYIQPRGWRRVTVVTSDFHADRASYAFKKVMGQSVDLMLSPVLDRLSSVSSIVAREAAISSFIRKLFEPVPDGDTKGVFATLQQLVGYSSNPRYSRQQLERIIARREDGLYG